MDCLNFFLNSLFYQERNLIEIKNLINTSALDNKKNLNKL